MAEDDPDDRLMISRALEDHRIVNQVHYVPDGEQLLRYLRHEGPYADADAHPMPTLILLDLNMPRVDGREALEAIKKDPGLRHIPVVVLTTSKAEEDVARAYQAGANSYITKPVTFVGLAAVLRSLKHYWFEMVELPEEIPPS
jgi:two-component system response regulator